MVYNVARMLSPQEAFKIGFLSRCVEEGLSLEQAHARVKVATDKLAALDIPGKLIDFGSNVSKTVLDKGLNAAAIAGIAAPPIAGGLTGYSLAKATDIDDTDVEEIKRREVIDELRRQTTKLQRNRQARDYRKDRKRAGRVFL